MSYEIDYVTLPVFTSKSIGYTINNASTFTIPANNSSLINVCNFALGIGVYMLTVNIVGLTTTNYTSNFWNGGISTVSTNQDIQTSFCTCPTTIGGGSGINFTHIISSTTPGTIYVQLKPLVSSSSSSVSFYNCSIVRIA